MACTERLALSEVVGVASPLAIVSRSVNHECLFLRWEGNSILQAKILAVYDIWAMGEYFHLFGVDHVAQHGYTWHTDMKVCT